MSIEHVSALVLVTAFGLLALALALGGLLNDRTRWRQCMKCGCYFNRLGETRTPYFTINMGHPGVCPECGKDLAFGKE